MLQLARQASVFGIAIFFLYVRLVYWIVSPFLPSFLNKRLNSIGNAFSGGFEKLHQASTKKIYRDTSGMDYTGEKQITENKEEEEKIEPQFASVDDRINWLYRNISKLKRRKNRLIRELEVEKEKSNLFQKRYLDLLERFRGVSADKEEKDLQKEVKKIQTKALPKKETAPKKAAIKKHVEEEKKQELPSQGKVEPQELAEFYSNEYLNNLIVKALHSSEQELEVLELQQMSAVQPHGEAEKEEKELKEWNEWKQDQQEFYQQPIFVVEAVEIQEWPASVQFDQKEENLEKKQKIPQKEEEERFPTFQQFEKEEKKEEGFEGEKKSWEKRENLQNKEVSLPESPKLQKEQGNLLGKKSISDIVSQATSEEVGGPPS